MVTTSGNTTGIVDEMEFYLRKDDYETFNVADGISQNERFRKPYSCISNLWSGRGFKQIGKMYIMNFKAIDFTGKIVAIAGLGNQFAFGESYVGAMKVLYDVVVKNGGKVTGFTSYRGISL